MKAGLDPAGSCFSLAGPALLSLRGPGRDMGDPGWDSDVLVFFRMYLGKLRHGEVVLHFGAHGAVGIMTCPDSL